MITCLRYSSQIKKFRDYNWRFRVFIKIDYILVIPLYQTLMAHFTFSPQKYSQYTLVIETLIEGLPAGHPSQLSPTN